MPDLIRTLAGNDQPRLRNAQSLRPWQHVLEPLGGYLLLGARLAQSADPQRYAEGWNFGPDPANVRPVRDVAEALIAEFGRGEMIIEQDAAAPHEAFALALNCDKAHQLLDWHPVWGFRETIARTVEWYARWLAGEPNLRAVTRRQIDEYVRAAEALAEPSVERHAGG